MGKWIGIPALNHREITFSSGERSPFMGRVTLEGSCTFTNMPKVTFYGEWQVDLPFVWASRTHFGGKVTVYGGKILVVLPRPLT